MARTTVATGITYRHSRRCVDPQGCRRVCGGSYEPWVYSGRDGKKIRPRPNDGPFKTLAAAKGWRADALSAVRKKQLRAPTSQTLRQAVEEWLVLAASGAVLARTKQPYKPAVIRNYELALRLRVLPDLGDRRLSNIDTADLLALKEKLLSESRSPSTVRNTFTPLQAIFRRAVLNGRVAINPTLGLDLPTGYKHRERIAPPDEAVELITALPEGEQALWATAFYAGLRRGELRALRARNVDLPANLIRVEHGWDDKEGEIEPKSKRGRRTVPIPAVLRPYLVNHLVLTARRDGDFVFGSTAATPFTPKNVRRKALTAWKQENEKRAERKEKPLEPILLHEARHTYVTLMFYAGLPLERIGDYVGHSSAYMTDRYRHLMDGHEKEAGDLLDAFLARANTTRRIDQVTAP